MSKIQSAPMQLLHRSEVLALIGVSKETLLSWMSKGKFPTPLLLGERARAWRVDEIDVWLQTRERPTYKARESK